jgi:serine/threonine protein kinase
MILSGSHASAEQLARFRAEGEAVARLQHPNIVQIHEVGEQDGRPFFSLEFVDGDSLDRKLRGTPFPPREAAQLTETLARAVEHAHRHGIVHRDLKPANVLLASEGASAPRESVPAATQTTGWPTPGASATGFADLIPKITDFGLAKQLDAEVAQTNTGAIMGTPSYMAPEQAKGDIKQIGPATDVYALGAILYEVVTGRPPFHGSTLLETLDQVCRQDPIRPTRLQPNLPRDLETICLKCLEKMPERRYASAWELAEELGRYLRGEPVRARAVSVWERGYKWVRKEPDKVALAGILAVLLVRMLVRWVFVWVPDSDSVVIFTDHAWKVAMTGVVVGGLFGLPFALLKSDGSTSLGRRLLWRTSEGVLVGLGLALALVALVLAYRGYDLLKQ